MKSVKSKLFVGFSIVIFIILLLLSFVSIELFSYNQERESLSLIDETAKNTTLLVEERNDETISQLDRHMDMKNQYVIILKNERILFSNLTHYKTRKMLEEIFEEKYDDYDHYERRDSRHKHDKHDKRKSDFYKDLEEDGYLKIHDFIVTYDEVRKRSGKYEIYVGIDEDIIDGHVGDVVFGIILLNITIFIILLILGYILINRTIKPLKTILDEVKVLEKANDLSKRLKTSSTNDEFEELSNRFNRMLENIENSVENIKQFSSDASHELKTPITVIQGEIELCKSSEKSKEELIQSLDKIDEEQKNLQEIIRNFLLLSRLDKEVLKHQSCYLDKTLFEMIEKNLNTIEDKKLELKLQVDEDLNVNFDEKYLAIVINNLLTNAIKYTNEGFIRLTAKQYQNKTILTIEDSGMGIDSKELEKIFERFYRVDKVRSSSKDGIGLGLSIVKKICERFETKIDVKSRLNEGSSFTLTFL